MNYEAQKNQRIQELEAKNFELAKALSAQKDKLARLQEACFNYLGVFDQESVIAVLKMRVREHSEYSGPFELGEKPPDQAWLAGVLDRTYADLIIAEESREALKSRLGE